MDTRSLLDDRGVFLGSNSPFHPPVSMTAPPPPTQGTVAGGLHHLGAMYHNLGSSHRPMRSSPVAPTQPTVAGQMSGLPAHFQGAGKCFPPPPQTLPGASSGSSYASCLSSFLPPSRSPDLFKHHQADTGPQPPHSLPLASHYWPHAPEGLHPFAAPFYHPYLPLTPLHPSAPEALASLAHGVPTRIGADTNLPSLVRPPSQGDILPFNHHERQKELMKGHTSKSEHKSRKSNECSKRKSDKYEPKDNALKGQSNQKQKFKSNHDKNSKLLSEPSQSREMQLKENIIEQKSPEPIVTNVFNETSSQSIEYTSKAKDACEEVLVSEQIQVKGQGKVEHCQTELITDIETVKDGGDNVDHKQLFAKECFQEEDKISERVSEKIPQTNATSEVVENVNVSAMSETVSSEHTDAVELPKIEKSDNVASSAIREQVAPLYSRVTEPVRLAVSPVVSTSMTGAVSVPTISPVNSVTNSELEALGVVQKNSVKDDQSNASTTPPMLTAPSSVDSLSTLNNLTSSTPSCHTQSSKYTVSSGQNKLSAVNQHTSSSLTSLPLYVNGTGCLTVQRESNRGAVRDGNKVHATTFVPAMGDYIPTFGTGSAHREGKPKSLVPGVEHNNKPTVKKEKGNACKMSPTSTETKDICITADQRCKTDNFSSKPDSHSQFLPKQSETEPNSIHQSTDPIKVEQSRPQDNITNTNTDTVSFAHNKHTANIDKMDVPKNVEDGKNSPKDQHVRTPKPITARSRHRSEEDSTSRHLKHITDNYPPRKQDFAGVKSGPKGLESSQQGRSTPSGKAPPPVGIAVAQKRHGSKDSSSNSSRSRGKFIVHPGSRPSSVDQIGGDGTRGRNERPSSKTDSIIDGSRPSSNTRLGSNLIVTGGDDYRRSSLLKSDSSTPSLTPEHHWYSRMAAAAARPTYLSSGAYGLPSTHPATYNPAGGDSAQGQVPLPPPGWQLAKDPTTGQLLWVPAIDAGSFPYMVPPHIQHPSHPLLMNQHMYGLSQHERQEQASREYQAAIQHQHAYAEYVRQAHERQEQHKREVSRSRLDYVHSQEQTAEVTHCHPYLPGIGHLGLPSMYPGHGGTQYVFDPATRAFIPVPSPSISVDDKHRPKPPSSRGSSASELASPRSTSHSVKSESKGKSSKEPIADVKSISVQTSTEPSVKEPEILNKDTVDKEEVMEKAEEQHDSSDCEVIDVGGTPTQKPSSPDENKTCPPELTHVTIGTDVQSGEALDLSMKADSQSDPSDLAKRKSLDNNNSESLPDHESASKVSVQKYSANDFDSLQNSSTDSFDRSEDVTCAMHALLNLTACVPNVKTTEPVPPAIVPDVLPDVKPDVPDVKPDVPDAKLGAPDVKLDVPDVDTSQLASLEGIALLSAVAHQRAFCDYSFSENSGDNESVKEDEPIEKLTGNTVSSADSQSASELLYKQRLAKMKKDEEKTSGADDIKLAGDVMNPSELEMRMKMAEIQRKYKERKREWDRLQRRKLKKIQKVDKKSPGRPRKRRSTSQHADKTVTFPIDRTHHRPSSTDVLISAAAEVDNLEQNANVKKRMRIKAKCLNTPNSTKKTKLNKKGNTKPNVFTTTVVKKKIHKESVKSKLTEGPTMATFNVGKPKKRKKDKMQSKESLKKVKSMTSKSKENVSEAGTSETAADNQIVLDAIKRAVQKSSNKRIGPKTDVLPATVKKQPQVQYSQVYGDSDTDESQEESLTLAQMSFFTSNKKKPDTDVSTEKAKLPKTKKKKRSHSDDNREPVVKKKKKRKDGSKSSEKGESRKKKSKKVQNKESPKHTVPEDNKEPLFDEQVWATRRRSERIFLNDTSPLASRDVSPVNKKQSHLNQSESSQMESTPMNVKQGSKLEIGLPSEQLVNVLDALTTDPLKMRKKLERLSGSGSDEKTKKTIIQTKTVPVKVKEIYSDDDDDDDDDENCDSESENLPLSVLRERPASPAQRSCAISPEELSHGLRVLIPIDNLFYPGYVRPIQPPDVYGVIIDGQRGNKPHVFSQEQMLKEAILDVKPKSVRYLPEGSRICAYWSQQYRCLYPGTVVKGSPNPTVNTNSVSVEFDDGDSGKILIDDIRLLPPDYPVFEIEPSPVLLERRRRRKTSSISGVDPSLSKQKPIQTDKSDCDMRLLSECEGDDDVFIKEKSPMKSPKKKIKSPEKLHKKKKNKELRKLKKEENSGRRFSKKSERSESDGNKSPRDATKSKSKKKSKKLKLQKQIQKETRKEESRKRKYKGEKKPKSEPDDVGSNVGSLFVTPFVDSSDTVDSVTDGENLDMQMFPETDSDNNFSDSSTEDPEMRLMIAESKRRHYRVQSSSKSEGYRRHFWQWSGKSTQRRGIKGKAKKLFYKAIARGDEIIRVGECAVFLSTGRPHLPYIGRIESIWESWGGNMVVRVKWFYHPEETKGGRRPHDGKMALYLSPHVDENDVQTISHKCEVLSVEEYNMETKKNNGKCREDMYYFAGTYDPTNGHLIPVSQLDNKT